MGDMIFVTRKSRISKDIVSCASSGPGFISFIRVGTPEGMDLLLPSSAKNVSILHTSLVSR